MNEIAITAAQARELTDRIKVGVEAIWELVKQAYQARAWVALGYDSWDDYCTREFGTSRIRLPREERQEVVASMREIGMSTRAIASATGMSKDTAARALSGVANETPAPVTGTDGKTYTPRPQPQPEPEELELPQATALPQSDLDELNAEPPTWQPAGHLRDTDLADLKKTKEEPQKPRRTPITDDATRIGWEIRKAAEKLEKLTTDDRWSHNTEKMTPLLRGHLQYAIETATNAINDLTRKDQ